MKFSEIFEHVRNLQIYIWYNMRPHIIPNQVYSGHVQITRNIWGFHIQANCTPPRLVIGCSRKYFPSLTTNEELVRRHIPHEETFPPFIDTFLRKDLPSEQRIIAAKVVIALANECKFQTSHCGARC